ncbi:MAG TPA: outer membrane beta-barrel protein [Vicinamibacterales bacterium]|nr:outer membrane beta-barrel protein [Vicinamibacterales bacterium]
MSMGIRRWVVPTLVSLALMFAVTPAWAQGNQQNVSNQDSGIGVGVLAGIVRPQVKLEGFDEFFENKNGTMLGLWVGGNKNGLIGFTGEFIYLWRKADTPLGELKFPAFEIPAVFHINFGSSDRNKAMGYALVGPVFTFNLKQKLDGVDVEDDNDLKFRGADIGIMAGGGFEVIRIGVEVRGNWGLRNISESGGVNDIKTRSIEFVVKFRFN